MQVCNSQRVHSFKVFGCPRHIAVLCLLVFLAEAFSPQSLASDAPPPQQNIFAAGTPDSAAVEVALWTLPANAPWQCPITPAGGAITFTLPRLRQPAVSRSLAGADGQPVNVSAFGALHIDLTAAATGSLLVELSDATGKTWRSSQDLKAGLQKIQCSLTAASTDIDLNRLTRVGIGYEAIPETTGSPTLAITLQSLSLGPLESNSAEEIKSTWYYGFLSQYGYLAFFVVLLAISLGIPLPEEIFLLTAGYLAHLTITEPELGINVHIITLVCFSGILGGDLFIYSLGRYKGERVRQWRWFKRLLPETAFVRVRGWFDRYGVGATAAFRFIPPIRMPGFFAAGLLRQSPIKFILADGIACLVSIPTQIYLVYYFGDYVIPYVKKFNVVLVIGLVAAAVGYMIWELIHRKKAAAEPVPPGAVEANAHSATGIAALDGADAEHIHRTHSNQDGSEEPQQPPSKPAEN